MHAVLPESPLSHEGTVLKKLGAKDPVKKENRQAEDRLRLVAEQQTGVLPQ